MAGAGASDDHASALRTPQEAAVRREQEARTKERAAAPAAAQTRLRDAVASTPEPYRRALPSRDGHVGGAPAPAAIDECVEAARHREQVPTGGVRERTRLHQSLREAARETDALNNVRPRSTSRSRRRYVTSTESAISWHTAPAVSGVTWSFRMRSPPPTRRRRQP